MSSPALSRRTLSAIGSILVVVVIAIITACTHTGGSEHAGTDPDSGLLRIAVADLPSQAQHELKLIDAGGPFRYPGKDGSTFLNNEGVLPEEPRGYYHEYTVDTPGSADRGARRIITGKNGEFFYTDDHYVSFSRIDR